VSAAACFGQPAKFEVASIRPNQSGDRHSNFSEMDGNDGSKLTAQNVSLMNLIQRACGVKEYQIAGPEWLKGAKFDITAAMPANTPRNHVNPALRELLLDRFKLAFHRETKELPIYALVRTKGDPKLQPPADPDGQSGTWQGAGQLTGKHESMEHFAEVLSRVVDRPVIDMTGLSGAYDFKLDYAPDGSPAASDSANASLFTALQEQLGLKLESRKGPVEMLVIDRVEKVPTAN
jgi:uncharacterized protein (TIGR03435 family)